VGGGRGCKKKDACLGPGLIISAYFHLRIADFVNQIPLKKQYVSPSANASFFPFPKGLSVKEYLEGKEGKHKELMYKASKAGKRTGASGGSGLVPGARRYFDDGEETTYVMSDDMQVGEERIVVPGSRYRLVHFGFDSCVALDVQDLTQTKSSLSRKQQVGHSVFVE
jgi:hypothetical protein